MNLTRRDALAALAGVGALSLTGCSRLADGARLASQGPLTPPQADDDPVRRAVNKFTFGARPGEAADLRVQDLDDWFESQLNLTEEPASLQLMLGRQEIHQLSPYDLRDLPLETVLAQIQQAGLLRAIYSSNQVHERLVDFWNNHFNIFGRKGMAAYRIPLNERQVVRANALGQFPRMVEASAKSAAMLVFLDQQNSNPRQPNENYARELMELHTLGVDGGYTQRDVMEVARCFTGWTEERGFLRAKGSFKFEPSLHDSGAKVVLGEQISAGGGVSDGERVVQLVATHPSTARHISRKLCRFFLGEMGVERVAPEVEKTFTASEGDIKAMMRTLWQGYRRHQDWAPTLKRPLDFIASSLRALDANTDAGLALQRHLMAMGQPLHQWPMPDGYPDATASWTGSLLARWNFAADLAANRIPGTTIHLPGLVQRGMPAHAPGLVAHRPDLSPSLARTLAGLDLNEQVGLMLAAPEFQWR